MASTSFRLVWDGLHLRLTATVTSEAIGFALQNLFDGSRHSFWRATTTGDQVILWDAGSGNTEAVDTTVIARADRLVTVAAHVVTEWSADAVTSWTAAYPAKTPIVAGDLKKPADQDFYLEHTALETKRGWRVRLFGTPSAVAECALVWLGKRLTVETAPGVGPSVGVARPHVGAPIEVTWPVLTEAGMRALAAALADVTKTFPAEGPLITRAGTGYGGRAHFLYDASGSLFRLAALGTPALAHVLYRSPEVLPRMVAPRLWTLGPCRWETVTA